MKLHEYPNEIWWLLGDLSNICLFIIDLSLQNASCEPRPTLKASIDKHGMWKYRKSNIYIIYIYIYIYIYRIGGVCVLETGTLASLMLWRTNWRGVVFPHILKYISLIESSEVSASEFNFKRNWLIWALISKVYT